MNKNKTKDNTPYWQYGNPEAPEIIVLIHGYRGTHHGLELIANELASHGFNVLVPDLPGFGEGIKMNNYYLEDYSNWLNEFIKELKLTKKPHLLGHSFGSIITAHFASNNSDKIDNLILLNPIPSPVSKSKSITDFFGDSYYKIGGALPNSLSKKWFSAKITTLVASEFMIKNRSKENRHFINNAHLEHFSDFTNVNSLTESYKASSDNSVKEYASKIKSKTLLIVGDKDDIAPLKKQYELKGLFQDVDFKIIKGVGHLTHYETPKEVGEIIKSYLNKKSRL